MDVSENNGTPKSAILIRYSIINHPFWGTPIFGNTHIGFVSFRESAYGFLGGSLKTRCLCVRVFRSHAAARFRKKIRDSACPMCNRNPEI